MLCSVARESALANFEHASTKSTFYELPIHASDLSPCFFQQQGKAHLPTLNMPFFKRVQLLKIQYPCFLTPLQCFVQQQESGKAKLHRLRKPFERCKVLIVDEVSMVGCRMLRDIHSRLCEMMQCEDKPFGGMCVVLMGDFVQLTPVGQTELFGSVKVQVGGQDLNDVFGREWFQKFDEVSLVKQHRATCPQDATSVSAFLAWTASAVQTRMEFVDTIVGIIPEEFQDPTWQKTTIVSTDQKTVHAVNEVMFQQFAIARGLPIVARRLPMVDKYEMDTIQISYMTR